MASRPQLQRGTLQTFRVPQKEKTAEELAAEQERGLQELGALPSKIQERLFLGSCYNGRSMDALVECGITHVINVAEEVEDPGVEVRKLVAYERVNIREAENVFRQQVETYKALNARIGTLVSLLGCQGTHTHGVSASYTAPPLPLHGLRMSQ